MVGNMKSILLDTDIGTDIDDAVCLGYLLRQPKCDLVGITTVSTQPRLRASLASALCIAAGKTVPIHAGTDYPILGGIRNREVPQAQILSSFPHQADFPNASAIEFMRNTINARPGEITLLCVGPTTNVALLFSCYPGVAAKLKQLVLMCGVFIDPSEETGPVEWDAMCDPTAAAITYKSSVVSTSIGTNVTFKCRMPVTEAITRFDLAGGPFGVVSAMASIYGQTRPTLIFNDPLAAAVIFCPGICDYEQGLVEVELESDRAAGMTHFVRGTGPHKVASVVRPEMFMNHFFDVIS
jgi:purine nucleosidase